MQRIDRGLFKLPVLFILCYFVLHFFFSNALSMGTVKFTIFSIILFLVSIFFCYTSKYTKNRFKEVYFSVLSAMLLYFSIFVASSVTNIFVFNIWGVCALILFTLFIFLEVGEFRNKVLHFTLLLLFAVKLISMASRSHMAELGVMLIALAFCIFLYFYRRDQFEKQRFIELLFGFSLTVVMKEIILII